MSETAATTTLVILGASGDLTKRLLLPGLGTLLAAQPERRVRVWGSAMDDLPDWSDRLRKALTDGGAPPEAVDRVASDTRYLRLDVTDGEDVDRLLEAIPDLDDAVLYFALPPAISEKTCALLAERDLGGLRLALEKPFGTDLESARDLNDLLTSFRTEDQVFRVDHFLGEAQVLGLLGLRFANRLLEPLWRGEHVERVEIRADETISLVGRAGYYDSAGALRDMLQSHLLLVLALVAMEAPARIDALEMRDLMAHALRATRLAGEPAQASRRARYTAGTVAGGQVPSYVDEPGVDPDRGTETLAEMDVRVDTARWAGVPFRLRSGKAMAADDWRIDLWLRPVAHLPGGLGGHATPNRLSINLLTGQIDVWVTTNSAADTFELESTQLRATVGPSRVRPYGEVLAKVLDADPLLSVRGDMSEECWRICTPVLTAFDAGEVPLEEYPAGTTGPWHED